jgi:hypothetical protein
LGREFSELAFAPIFQIDSLRRSQAVIYAPQEIVLPGSTEATRISAG